MAADESRFPRELNLALHDGLTGPLRERVAGAYREAIRAGRLRPGDRLPSTRSLAEQIGVSRGVISNAYADLAAGGYLEVRDRAAPRVAGGPRGPLRVISPAGTGTASRPTALAPRRLVATAPRRQIARPGGAGSQRDSARDGIGGEAGGGARAVVRTRYDFDPLAGDLSAFPRRLWARCTADVLRTISDAELGYIDAAGHPWLRAELAEYLRRVRATSADASRLLVMQGNTQALNVSFAALAAHGARRVAIENPSFASAWSAVARAGLQAVPLAVDQHGARTDRLDQTGADVVLLTPAHQFPLGPVLSAGRREQLLMWLRGGRRYAVEDDYDAEFPAPGAATASIQGTCPERVIYVGTASRMLAPGLRLGWLLAPSELVDALAEIKLRADGGSPTINQLVFAELLRRGLLDRHLRQLRSDWRQRREALVGALRERVPWAQISGERAGSHVTVLFGGWLREAALRRQALGRGVSLRTLDEFAFAPHDHGAGVVLGYPELRPAELERACELLVAAIGAAVSLSRPLQTPAPDLPGPG